MHNVNVIRTIVSITVFLVSVAFQNVHAETPVTPAEARAIAKEAYIYANPMVDNYRILYGSWRFSTIEPVK